MKSKITIKCARCGELFVDYPSRARRKYCSKECGYRTHIIACPICHITFPLNHWAALRRINPCCSKKCSTLFQLRQLSLACDYCGSTFLKKKSQHKRSTRHFCSLACSRAFHCGRNHHKFSPTDYGYGRQWKEIAKHIRLRDKVCQICGKTPHQNGQQLDVHHKIPFAMFGLSKWREAHKDSNLVALCRSCHSKLEPRQ